MKHPSGWWQPLKQIRVLLGFGKMRKQHRNVLTYSNPSKKVEVSNPELAKIFLTKPLVMLSCLNLSIFLKGESCNTCPNIYRTVAMYMIQNKQKRRELISQNFFGVNFTLLQNVDLKFLSKFRSGMKFTFVERNWELMGWAKLKNVESTPTYLDLGSCNEEVQLSFSHQPCLEA